MNIEFKDIKELYKRVLPALRVKKRLFLKKGIKINEEDIFEYLAREKWSKANNLTLSDIVSDIINVKDDVFIGR
ncbi:MAG: hypothetical protein IJ105_04560 [Bacilli bacterium]|nr:hypothetical protein [Bacilli bacterium]